MTIAFAIIIIAIVTLSITTTANPLLTLKTNPDEPKIIPCHKKPLDQPQYHTFNKYSRMNPPYASFQLSNFLSNKEDGRFEVHIMVPTATNNATNIVALFQSTYNMGIVQDLGDCFVVNEGNAKEQPWSKYYPVDNFTGYYVSDFSPHREKVPIDAVIIPKEILAPRYKNAPVVDCVLSCKKAHRPDVAITIQNIDDVNDIPDILAMEQWITLLV